MLLNNPKTNPLKETQGLSKTIEILFTRHLLQTTSFRAAYLFMQRFRGFLYTSCFPVPWA